MKVENKWADFDYQEPEHLSERCLEDYMAIQGSVKDGVELQKAWHSKYRQEVDRFRETKLANISNFCFMTSFFGTEKWAGAEKVLQTYLGKCGFFHIDGKWICNHVKALAIIEKKGMHEVDRQPVYGGAYEMRLNFTRTKTSCVSESYSTS